MDTTTMVSLVSLAIAFLALVLNIESRLRDRPQVGVRFGKSLYAVFGDPSSRDHYPETLESISTVINTVKRGVSALEVKCSAIQGDEHYELLNGSALIYRTLQLPIDIAKDSSHGLRVVWILGQTGNYAKYNGRFSLLPQDVQFELRVSFSNGKTASKRYQYRDIESISFKEAQEYRAANHSQGQR